jgi:hypothetical protein
MNYHRWLSRYRGRLHPGRQGFDSWQGHESFLYSTAYRPALGPGGSFPRDKDRGVNLTTHLHQVQRLIIMELYLQPPTPCAVMTLYVTLPFTVTPFVTGWKSTRNLRRENEGCKRQVRSIFHTCAGERERDSTARTKTHRQQTNMRH